MRARAQVVRGAERGLNDAIEFNACIDARSEASSAADRDSTSIQTMQFSLDDLDPDIDPRDDLDGHVNGRWRARTTIPEDRGCWDSFAIVADATLRAQREIAEQAAGSLVLQTVDSKTDPSLAQAGKFGATAGAMNAETDRGLEDTSTAIRIVGALWHSGMDLAARERAGCDAMANDLARIAAITSRGALAVFIDQAHARGDQLLWSIDVVPDPANLAAWLMRLSPARGPLGRGDLLGSSRAATRRRRLCTAYFAGLLRRSGDAVESAHEQSRHALSLEQALASAMPDEATRDVAALHRRIALVQAQRELSPLWLGACVVAAGVKLPNVVSLPSRDFHATVAQLLSGHPIAHWQAWLRVRLLDAAAPEISSDMRSWHHRFHGRALRGMRVEPPLWKQVLAAIDRMAPDAMAQLYVSRHVSPDTARRMRELFESLRRALRARIAAADWLGTVARNRAIAKIDAMRARLVAPERWPDWTEVELGPARFHASMRLLRAHALRRRLRALQRALHSEDSTQGIHGASLADDWSMPAHRVNARYDPQRNCIEVPAGILQPPFFDPQASRASQYGAIGAVMAHEMSHGFDDQGRRFDADGRLGDGWPVDDVAGFDRRADAVAEWFDTMPDGIGGRVDGRRTLGENLADMTGLAVAWDAYRMECAVERSVDEASGGKTAVDAPYAAHRDDPNRGAGAVVDAQAFFYAWAVMWRQLLTPAEAQRRAALDHHAPARLRANVAPTMLDGFWTAFDGRRSETTTRVSGVW